MTLDAMAAPRNVGAGGVCRFTGAVRAQDMARGQDHPGCQKRFGGSAIAIGYEVRKLRRGGFQTSTLRNLKPGRRVRRYAQPPLQLEGKAHALLV